MSKRHSKSLRFFCFPEELDAILDPVLVKYRAQWCVAEGRSNRYFFRPLSILDVKAAPPCHLYACDPSMLVADGVDSLANIVQLWVPVSEGDRLRMGEVGVLIAESDLSAEHRRLGESIYRDARKALTRSFGRGVLGRNSRTGGQYRYDDILISERAVRASSEGMVLTSLMGDGFVSFYAASDDAGASGGD